VCVLDRLQAPCNVAQALLQQQQQQLSPLSPTDNPAIAFAIAMPARYTTAATAAAAKPPPFTSAPNPSTPTNTPQGCRMCHALSRPCAFPSSPTPTPLRTAAIVSHLCDVVFDDGLDALKVANHLLLTH